MGKKANAWLKRIFSVSTITTIATVVAACIAVIEFTRNNGGTFTVFLHNEEAKSPIDNTVFVYLDRDSADLSKIGVFPVFTNPSKYSLQDVLLTYKIETSLSNVSYSDFFSVQKLDKGLLLTNIDKTLYAKTDLPEPFYSFYIRNNGTVSIDINATYQGVEKPFTYHADIFAKKLFFENHDKRKNAIFNDANQLAKKYNIKSFDIYILNEDGIEKLDNVSQTSLLQNSDNDIKIENKKASQIEVENKELIKASQESQSTPWYIYVVNGILFLVATIAFITYIISISVFFDTDKRFSSIIGFVMSTIVMYLCAFYVSDLPSNKFWACLVIAFVISITLVLLLIGSEKVQERFGITNEDLGTLIFMIPFLLLMYPIGKLCIFLYQTIPF